MSELEEVARAAKSLDATDRLRLIARLWASLPRDHWAAPTPKELADVQQRLANVDPNLLGDVPWIVVSRLSAAQPAQPATRIYSAPRRFDLSSIFAVTTAYAILFGCMRGLDFGTASSLLVAAFIALVGIGQAVLFGGRQPRKASIVVGAVALTLGTISAGLFVPGANRIGFLPIMAVFSFFWGSICGYLAGVLVGGVFLIADAIRQRFERPAAGELPQSAKSSRGS